MVKLIDLTGQTFGMLTVISRAGVDSTNKTTWKSKCACGGISIATGLNLKKGVTKSCGCLKRRKGFTELDAEKFINAPIEWLVTRHSAKNGMADLEKARHYIDLLIQLESRRVV